MGSLLVKICVVAVKVCREFRIGHFSARADPTPGHPGGGGGGG